MWGRLMVPTDRIPTEELKHPKIFNKVKFTFVPTDRIPTEELKLGGNRQNKPCILLSQRTEFRLRNWNMRNTRYHTPSFGSQRTEFRLRNWNFGLLIFNYPHYTTSQRTEFRLRNWNLKFDYQLNCQQFRPNGQNSDWGIETNGNNTPIRIVNI